MKSFMNKHSVKFMNNPGSKPVFEQKPFTCFISRISASVLRLISFSFFLITVLYFGSDLQADTVVLKSGKAMDGKVVSQTADTLTFTAAGSPKKQIYPKKEIFRILYNPTKEQRTQIINEALLFRKREIAKEKDPKAVDDEFIRLEEERTRQVEESLTSLQVKKEEQAEEVEVRLERRIAQLEERLKDAEYFLELNTDWKDYYGIKRNKWDIVWRSALIPGWGHSYAKNNFIGNVYFTTFFFSTIAYLAAGSAQRTAESTLNTKTTDLFLIRPLLYSAVLAQTTSTGVSTFSSTQVTLINTYNDFQRLNDYRKLKNAVHSAETNQKTALNLVAGIYLIQLVHAYFTGKTWASREVLPEAKSGWNFQYLPQFNPMAMANNGFQAELRYFWNF